MRTISSTTHFRRDYKQALSGMYRNALSQDFEQMVQMLASDQPLPAPRRDHALMGDLVGYRDCHIRGDLVLIYRKLGTDRLELQRLGTHSKLDL
jgi:mRNA interferase YafQ